MKHAATLLTAALPLATGVAPSVLEAELNANGPNTVFITLDDMNWDSVGAYGSPVPNITPNMDRLAREGMRFQHAYVQSPSCVPSRNALITGRYPHTSGVTGFFNVVADFQTLPEALRDNGYFTGVVNKPRDSSPNGNHDRFWDYHRILTNDIKRDPEVYADTMNVFLDEAAEHDGPFFCMVNIADPHKPFFNEPKSIKQGSNVPPSRIYGPDEVPVPPTLPDHPEIREEMANYYNSVKRGDDCIAAVLDTLEERGLMDNAVIMLISDHGMPLPYAKSTLYREGLRTPWIVRWPGVVEPNSVDDEHLISAIDFAPTVLDIVGAPTPEGMQGQSFKPLLMGDRQENRDYIFAEFNDNAAGKPRPSRAIHGERYGYIFNAWGTGDYPFVSAWTWHNAYKVMQRMAKRDDAVAERFRFLRFRTVEELYDFEADPYALNNLIDDPAYRDVAEKLRLELEAWMVETEDPVLAAFRVRHDPSLLNAYMKREDAAALHRAETLQWKRWRNRLGGTGGERALYDPDAATATTR